MISFILLMLFWIHLYILLVDGPLFIMQLQEYLTNPVQVKVGKVSSPTANVSQILEKVAENEKVSHLYPIGANCWSMIYHFFEAKSAFVYMFWQFYMVHYSNSYSAFSGYNGLECIQVDRLLALLVEEAAQADRSGHPHPLTIVFVERKVRKLYLGSSSVLHL